MELLFRHAPGARPMVHTCSAECRASSCAAVWAAAASCLVPDATNSETRKCSALLPCRCCVPALHEAERLRLCWRARGCSTVPSAFLSSCRQWLFCHGKEQSCTITSLFGTVCVPWNCTYQKVRRWENSYRVKEVGFLSDLLFKNGVGKETDFPSLEDIFIVAEMQLSCALRWGFELPVMQISKLQWPPACLQQSDCQGAECCFRLIQGEKGCEWGLQTALASRANISLSLIALECPHVFYIFWGEMSYKFDTWLCGAISVFWGYFPVRPKTITFCCQAKEERDSFWREIYWLCSEKHSHLFCSIYRALAPGSC